MDDMPDQARSPYVTAAFIVSLQQVNKLDLGDLEWMITSYQEMVVCPLEKLCYSVRPSLAVSCNAYMCI